MNRTVSKKFGFITVLLTIVLVFGLTPLAAQNKLSWGKRSLVGMPYRNSSISINNVKFGALQGGGDPNVVEIRDVNNKVTGKTTVNKITKSNMYYVIKLTGNQLLEVSGTYTASGLTGQVFYVIKGPTELFLGTQSWPNVSIGISSEYDTMVYYDQASFNRDIAEQFVDKYIVPVVNYDSLTKLYDTTKKQVDEHVKKTGKCPSTGCPCKGDIAQHIIYNAAIKQGFLGGAIGALPLPLGVAAEVTAERKKVKQNAVLAALIGKHYGWYKSKKDFDDRFRNHALVLFSGADVPNAGATAAGEMKEEMVMKSSEKLFKMLKPGGLSAIPGIGNAIGFAFGGITSSIETRKIGNDAVRFYRK